MKLYIVRHGESTHNALKIHQPGQVELSTTGNRQAKFLGKRFENIPIDLVVSSDLERTRRTAEIINSFIHKKIIFEPLLREIKRSSEIEGKPVTDKSIEKIKDLITKNRDNPKYHYSDEENFWDLKKRVEDFLKKLDERIEENILLVSHGVTIRMLAALMVFKKELSPAFFDDFIKAFRMINTGITVCEKKDDNWHIITWNDHAHLG